MSKVSLPKQWVVVACVALFACIVAVQWQVLRNSDNFNTCLKRNSTGLVANTNRTNDALRNFLTDASKISKSAASLPPNSPKLAELKLKYSQAVTQLKFELRDSKPPGCSG